MLILAASWPISTITLVLRPKLANLLRFKAIAVTRLGEGLVFTATAVLLAAWGWGPYALAWPFLLSACFSALVFWRLSGRLPLQRPRPESWPTYVAPGLLLMFGNFVSVMTIQAPNFIVGSLLDVRRTGLYAWGYLVASQAIFLLVVNLRGLFTPVFSRLKNEPARMAEATAKSVYAISAVVAPICVLQAFLARPLIQVFFPPRWNGAADVVFWLSLGFCAQPAALIAQSALVAAGKFGVALRLALLQALMIVLGVAWGCAHGDIQAVALGAAVAGGLCLPVNLWVLRASIACPWGRLLDTPKALFYSALAFAPSYGCFRLAGGTYTWWGCTLAVLVYGLSLVATYRLFDPGIFRSFDGLQQGKGALSKALGLLGGGR
jgi:PST family polysaccharide transporter